MLPRFPLVLPHFRRSAGCANRVLWGVKRLAREFGTCPKTVRRYVREGAWSGYSRARRVPALEELSGRLEERLVRHGGNADVVRQELAAEHGLVVSLRTVERACAPYRQTLLAAVRATVRFETPPGQQLQIDFGERRVTIAGVPVRVHLFVATLGHSRRLHVRASGVRRRRIGLRELRELSRLSAACPRRSCSTTPTPWWTGTMRQRARWCSTPACTPLCRFQAYRQQRSTIETNVTAPSMCDAAHVSCLPTWHLCPAVVVFISALNTRRRARPRCPSLGGFARDRRVGGSRARRPPSGGGSVA